MELDLIVKGGTIVTGTDVYRADVGVAGGKIAALGLDLGRAPRIVNAVAKYVLPGAIDVHTHFEMPFIRARRDQGRREEWHRQLQRPRENLDLRAGRCRRSAVEGRAVILAIANSGVSGSRGVSLDRVSAVGTVSRPETSSCSRVLSV